ncbi:MAG: hypothetical protein KF861_17540 [Planctomycetaceae bacterium]|nr:hypothetical protein [Planctomycetaceae bacterium]
MLVFRFLAGLSLLIAVSLVGIRLETRELALKRAISLQHFRIDQLLEERTRLRIRLHERLMRAPPPTTVSSPPPRTTRDAIP